MGDKNVDLGELERIVPLLKAMLSSREAEGERCVAAIYSYRLAH